MNFLNTCSALLMLTLLPIAAGMGLILPFKSLGGEEKKSIFFDIIWSWFFGQLLLWCVFKPIAVRQVLKSGWIEELRSEYLIGVGVLLIASILLCAVGMVVQKKRGKDALYKAWGINSESAGTLASSEKTAQGVDIGGGNEKMLRVNSDSSRCLDRNPGFLTGLSCLYGS